MVDCRCAHRRCGAEAERIVAFPARRFLYDSHTAHIVPLRQYAGTMSSEAAVVPVCTAKLHRVTAPRRWRYRPYSPAQASRDLPARTTPQYRILRRILEKRQAQAKHRMNKVIVPKDLEPLKGEKYLDEFQKVCNFAS